MIASVPHDRRYWKVSYDRLEVLYCTETEFINATQLCYFIRKRDCLEKWYRTDAALRLQFHLNKQLEPGSPTEFKVKTNKGWDCYIHPALALHLATWFGMHYNYPMCKLLQQITINTTLAKQPAQANHHQQAKTHTFTFLELSKEKNMHQYYAVECDSVDCGLRIGKVKAIWPKAEIIFQHHYVPEKVKVIEALKANWNDVGDISINENHYCGSAMEVALLTLIRKLCQSEEDPTIMCVAYDEPDCSAYDIAV